MLEPLAYRMAPRSLDEFIGQEQILAEGKLLYRMIRADRLSSILLFGPPGTGKTSLARVIAASTELPFRKLNAVTSGVNDIKKVIEENNNTFLNPNGRTVLFIDEIHRFNKAQQDALLPQVEDGSLILIGATTENPYFEVNKALVSRSTVFKLEPLTTEDIRAILFQALQDNERGYGDVDIDILPEAVDFVTNVSNGDARRALNALELAVMTTNPDDDGRIRLTREVMKDSMQSRSHSFDAGGEVHYDNISAFIKSMRGSDPDAAVFYLARALEGGEDIEFLARRIVIAASEDVGMANPQALTTAMSAYEAIVRIGMPEARIILSQATIMVATSPKSNRAYLAINRATEDVRNIRTGEIPYHIRNAPASGMKDLGYGSGYLYPHDYPGAMVNQQYLPDEVKDKVYYEPSSRGYEARIREWLAGRQASRQKRGQAEDEKD